MKRLSKLFIQIYNHLLFQQVNSTTHWINAQTEQNNSADIKFLFKHVN